MNHEEVVKIFKQAEDTTRKIFPEKQGFVDVFFGLSFATIFFGSAILFIAFSGGDNRLKIPPTLQLPLSSTQSIVADKKGNIYISSDLYYRIQIYDKYGSFIRAIQFSEGYAKGESLLAIDYQERIWIYKRESLMYWKNNHLTYIENFPNRHVLALDEDGELVTDKITNASCTFQLSTVFPGERLFPSCQQDMMHPDINTKF
ncbi:MAG: hypothetical protein A2Y62_20770 [Candidatus Fischerbacteria bacterium RBG_13_37_8]|uniref:Uncharacterized protein n=1 Tax=Candidatus Fischerbacteria bacterium RBG_13_37_8 TaxID=1817863 RepID=A0A1F5VY62_9BACT|nr:MAG: hypothetical protein A2Y62_20770 [Candidatus Fischerbacteria bacterium RBG_13_37_8]